ncbi:MAG: PmoA family protein [Gemmataceae bacterium]|nr:PmoA family protein [Gemmataceae bacterium]
MNKILCAAIVGILALAEPAVAQNRTIDLEITHTNDLTVPIVTVPLSLAKEDAERRDLMVDVEGSKAKPMVMGQLTVPGLRTAHIKPSAEGLVRRDLHIDLFGSFKAGTITKVKVHLGPLSKPISGFSYDWSKKDGKFAELSLNYGKRPVLRYVHSAYDNSSKEKRVQTNMVFHHLYVMGAGNPFKGGRQPRFITNGGDTNDPLPKDPKDNLYPHHRGLMFAYSKITYDGDKQCNMWSAQPGDTHQAHAGFLATEAGRIIARQRVAVDWHGPDNKVFAKEEREITVLLIRDYLRKTLVEFTSRLKTTGGLVKLRGDPQHAGFQFRAHNDLYEQKNEKQTYFLRPDGKGEYGETRNWDPKTETGPVNLPWDACSFVIDGKRFTVAYLNHPDNPGESRWSERTYGRFGCYFEYDLTEKNPLVVTYRVWVQDGEMTVDAVEALSNAFREPPKVTVK